MDGLLVAVLVLFSIWLGVLTVTVVLTVRQIALLTVRLSREVNRSLLESDGPEPGSELPVEVTDALPELAGERRELLLLSGSCTPCRELAAYLDERDFESPTTIALVTGSQELADGIVELLPDEMRTVCDPDAGRIAEALDIHSTPVALAVEKGVVDSKIYVYQPEDLLHFIEDKPSSNATRNEISTRR